MVDKVKLLVSNKVVSSGPVPMDLSVIGNGSTDRAEHYFTADGWDNWADEQVAEAVGMHIQCHACGRWGRECPTAKGKRNGEPKGGGKFQGEGGGKGKTYSGPGKGGGLGKAYQGQGYQGKCHNSGEVGHKKHECKVPPRNVNLVDETEHQQQPHQQQHQAQVSTIPAQAVESV